VNLKRGEILQGRSETKFIEAKRKPLQKEGQDPFNIPISDTNTERKDL
jgi:hypothetical protein